jgi:hypothetical protein
LDTVGRGLGTAVAGVGKVVGRRRSVAHSGGRRRREGSEIRGAFEGTL